MELLAIALMVGALVAGFKMGQESGRNVILAAQSRHIEAALAEDGDFYRKYRMHGSYILPGHEDRSPIDFVIVSYSELDKSRETPGQESGNLDISPEVGDHRADGDGGFQAANDLLLLIPSSVLARIVGNEPMTRTIATKRVWAYIRTHDLQDPEKQTMINCDETLRSITGRGRCSLFELTRAVGGHLKTDDTA